jgi:pantoate--beta-alanine ligase
MLIASIFVNPTQFGPGEDFERYPRPEAADLKICRSAGVDAVFLPPAHLMYAADHSTWVDECVLSGGLCGASRPGHFRGVCTVVLKLFLLTNASVAVFGEKDFQQLAIIRRMVRDLNVPVKIVGFPTVRESDGLALSSRNRYLSAVERERAPGLRRILMHAARQLEEGSSPGAVARGARRSLEKHGFRVDYLEVVDTGTLEVLKSSRERMTVAAAVFLGRTRLIDNIQVRAALHSRQDRSS